MSSSRIYKTEDYLMFYPKIILEKEKILKVKEWLFKRNFERSFTFPVIKNISAKTLASDIVTLPLSQH